MYDSFREECYISEHNNTFVPSDAKEVHV